MSTTARLYELADLRQEIDAALEASDGELTDDIARLLDLWAVAFPEKVQSIVLFVRDLTGDAEKVKAEEDRLAAKRQTLLNKAKWLTGYLQRCMEAAGTEKAGGPLGEARLALNPPRVEPVTTLDEPELRNIAVFAPRYVTHHEEWTLNKKAILEDYKAGTLDTDIAKRVAVVQTRSIRIR